jgi:hypothetical protein
MMIITSPASSISRVHVSCQCSVSIQWSFKGKLFLTVHRPGAIVAMFSPCTASPDRCVEWPGGEKADDRRCWGQSYLQYLVSILVLLSLHWQRTSASRRTNLETPISVGRLLFFLDIFLTRRTNQLTIYLVRVSMRLSKEFFKLC